MFRALKNGLAALCCCCFLAIPGVAQENELLDLAAVKDIPIWSSEHNKELSIGSSGKIEALVLISPECPMSINYTLTLNQLQEQYASELRITGIIVGSTYSDKTVLQFARSYNIGYTLLTDKKREVALKLKGEVTPEVYLFNQEGQCVYRGAIDNWLTKLGKKKQKPDQLYLADAVRQVIHGEPVTISYVKAQGCVLNEY
jgi:hypothetical protein